MGMGFAPTWLRQVSPLLHKTTLTTELIPCYVCVQLNAIVRRLLRGTDCSTV